MVNYVKALKLVLTLCSSGGGSGGGGGGGGAGVGAVEFLMFGGNAGISGFDDKRLVIYIGHLTALLYIFSK
ncbi:hypothetical protein E2C01_065770 [Portunus trituberculatus]|uniref:Uncharacterized protein n=1 Tax=Portunus trituberculatus TaxID=210409 RepID=A0A5B7HJS0_PORTR|nr:hypothetical protein [Portunus trituberculatus]